VAPVLYGVFSDFLSEGGNMQGRKVFLIFVLTGFLATGRAGEKGQKSGFEFLRTDIGGRPAAMGGAFTAVTGDLYGIRYNPASLVDIQDKASFTFLDHLLDMHSGFLAVNLSSLTGKGSLALSVAYTSYGELKKTDIQGTELGSFSPFDMLVSATYGLVILPELRFGVTAEFLHSKIDTYSASALSADAGLIYRIPSQDLNIGLAIQNMGTALQAFVDEKEKLPLAYRLGISKRLAHLPLLLDFDVIRYAYDESDLFGGLYWALGGEFTLSEHLLLRWGYNSRGQEENVGAASDRLSGISLGLGIRWRRFGIDYGYCDHGALGSMNHFSITMAL
jgi:hypothetical protein